MSYKPVLMENQLTDIWNEWGIKLLMAVSCSMHMVLTLFGSSRRRKTARQGLVWFTFVLANTMATAILGNLSVIYITTKSIINTTDGELIGFLAPLLLVQLGSHDAITAYSIEDVRLVVRQFFILIGHLLSVLWIILRTWNSSLVSYLYFPLYLAGAIRGGESVWAMYKALSLNAGITPSEFEKEVDYANEILQICDKFKDGRVELQMIITAYFRFIFRKPHIENWISIPNNLLYCQSSVFHTQNYKEVFQIADFELGFMYDVLYTKYPFVFTRFGLALRLTTSLCLISCSIAFACWSKDSFVYYIDAGFTLVVLGVIVTLEFYQIYMLFFSEWAIIKIMEHSKDPKESSLWSFLAPRSVKWKRWSKKMGQCSFINSCLIYYRFPCKTMLESQGLYFTKSSLDVTDKLKELLFEEMKKLDIWTRSRPVSERDDGAEEWCGVIVSFGVDEFKCSVKRRVLEQSIISDMSIIVWHIATEICYQHDRHKDSPNPKRKMKMGRYLSNYMMYILAFRPQMLSISTSMIVLEDARNRLVTFIKTKKLSSSKKRMVEKTVCRALLDSDVGSESLEKKMTEMTESKETKPPMKPTQRWRFLKEAKELSVKLLELEEERRWEVIWRVWVEVLCSAAANCKPDQHCRQLLLGGEILSHVWIILLHHNNASLPT